MDHHKDHHAIDKTQRPPTIFVLERIRDADVQRILKDKASSLKADFVLCQVLAAFLLVPDEVHLYIRQPAVCRYNYVRTIKYCQAL